jgi:hypothetical protein
MTHFKCTNPNAEISEMEKQDNNSTVKYLNDSEVDEISKNLTEL